MSHSRLLAGILTVALAVSVFELISQRRTIGKLRESGAYARQKVEKISTEKFEVIRARDELAREVVRLQSQRELLPAGRSDPANAPTSFPLQSSAKIQTARRPTATTERNSGQEAQWK